MIVMGCAGGGSWVECRRDKSGKLARSRYWSVTSTELSDSMYMSGWCQQVINVWTTTGEWRPRIEITSGRTEQRVKWAHLFWMDVGGGHSSRKEHREFSLLYQPARGARWGEADCAAVNRKSTRSSILINLSPKGGARDEGSVRQH